jgi:hypothetical protein
MHRASTVLLAELGCQGALHKLVNSIVAYIAVALVCLLQLATYAYQYLATHLM